MVIMQSVSAGNDCPCVIIWLAVAGVHGGHADSMGVASAADNNMSWDTSQKCGGIPSGR